MSCARPPGRAARLRRRLPGADLPAGFGVLWTTVAVDLLGFGIVVPLLPLYARHLGAGPVSIGLLLAAFSGAQLACAPVLGRVSDRVGRKPVLLLSLAGTAAASLLTGLAGSLWLLLVARVLDGASGGSVAVAQAAASDMVGPGQRARVFGMLGSAFGVGFVVGPAVGGLAALGGARLPFFVAAAIAGANTVVARRRLPETRPSPRSGGEGTGAWRGRRGVLGAVAVPAAITVLVVGAFSAFEATFPLFGHRRLGFGLSATGVVFALVGAVVAVMQLGVVRPAVARLGEAGCLRLGLGLEGVGLLLVPTVHSRPGLVVPLALVAAGQSLTTPTLAALVAGRVGPDRTGAALGAQQGSSALARVAGPLAGGLAYGLVGTGSPFVGGGLVVAGALVCSLVVRGGLATVPPGRPQMVAEDVPGRLPLSNNG